MSDALLRRLARANPVPAEVLADLDAQLRNQTVALPPISPRRGGPRRVLVLALLGAAAALVAVPALAWRFGVIDFSSAEPAPSHVVKDFALLSEGAPPGMDPRVVAGQTRRVGELAGHTLWVAPTKAGGLCYEWSGASGGCDSLGTVPLSVTWLSAGHPLSSAGSFVSVDGFAHARWVDEVLITLDDGSTVRPRVVWISPPIDAGFFHYLAPNGRAIATVEGWKDGEVVTADMTGTGERPGPHPFADLAKRNRIAEIQMNAGSATLWTAPTKTEGRCTWLEFGGREISVVPCLPKGYEHQAGLALAVHALGGHTILAGECGYAAIELLRRDGSIRTVRCEDGLIFTELDRADAAGEIRAIDAQGKPLKGSRIPVSRAIAPN